MNTVNELKIKTAHYIIAGFSLVVGLSWNDTVKEILNRAFPMNKDFILSKIVYSLCITLFLIILIRYMPDTTGELPKPVRTEIETFRNMYY